jgi:hypothetical protein
MARSLLTTASLMVAEYTTPKVSGAPPNLQGLDEKTAKLLLDERQVARSLG